MYETGFVTTEHVRETFSNGAQGRCKSSSDIFIYNVFSAKGAIPMGVGLHRGTFHGGLVESFMVTIFWVRSFQSAMAADGRAVR